VSAAGVGAILGTLWWRLGADAGLQKMGLLLFSALQVAFVNLAETPLTHAARRVALKQLEGGMYPPLGASGCAGRAGWWYRLLLLLLLLLVVAAAHKVRAHLTPRRSRPRSPTAHARSVRAGDGAGSPPAGGGRVRYLLVARVLPVGPGRRARAVRLLLPGAAAGGRGL
jgi:hypothetical protein